MPDVEQSPLTLVAVIRIDPDRPVSDLDRFLALALPSFRRWVPPELVAELVIVVPPDDVAEVTERTAEASPYPVRVVDERDLLPALPSDLAGWTRQQLIKLALPPIIRTPWFVLLDADIVAARPVDGDFLLPGGQAIWQQERAEAHYDWWQTSAEVLGEPTIAASDPAFGVTPAIMHTESVSSVVERIGERHPDQHWSLTLAAIPGWTEYTLYWTHAVHSGAAERLYRANENRPYALDGSIWEAGQLARRGARAQLEDAIRPDAPHAFFVLQSNLELPLEDTVALLRPHIEGTDETTEDERRAWRAHRAQYERRRKRGRLRGAARRLLGRG